MIVVDTNVTSELMKPAPAPAIVAWVHAGNAADLYTTSIALAEIAYRDRAAARWQAQGSAQSRGRGGVLCLSSQVLAFDAPAALEYATIVRGRELSGPPIDGFDAQIASICRAHGRNARHA